MCYPNLCQHNGTCIITEDTSTCNCDGTGYTGDNCEVLLINAPDISALIINFPTNFTFFSQPNHNFELELVPDDKESLRIEPLSIMFSQISTEHEISMTAKKSGLYKLEYKVNNETLNYKPIPPASILVRDNSTNTSYCRERNITCGFIEPGCCPASEVQPNLELNCPSDDNELLLKSTCGWVSKPPIPLHSAGIIFSSIGGFDMPVAIAGARFLPQTTHIDLQGLTTFEFDHGCVACIGNRSCQHEILSVNVVQEFLKFDSLAFTYLYQSKGLIPRWLTLKVLPSDRSHDFRSYSVYLVYSDALNRVQECRGLTALTDGLYSILVYTGNLEVTLHEETRHYESNGLPVCFAINLCEGSSSPLYVSSLDDAQNVLHSFEFMRNLKSKGWGIAIKNLVMSNANVIPEPVTSELSYWNGIEYFSPNLQNLNMITTVEFTKPFVGNSSIKANWNFIGNVYWFHEDINKVSLMSMT